MKLVALKPSLWLVKLFAIDTCVALLLYLAFDANSHIIELFIAANLALLCVLILDAARQLKPPQILISRDTPSTLSYDHKHLFSIKLTNNANKKIHVKITDCVPDEFELTSAQEEFELTPSQQLAISYRLRPLKRGSFEIGPIEVSIYSAFKLWQLQWHEQNKVDVKVYPNFNRINHSESLKGVNNTRVTGLKRLKKRGDGIEFHQLREFRQGDSIRQIDWQATSKRQKLISKEYQEEQNQHIIVMLDAGVKMNLETTNGTHFDTALNALLMLSHTVLKQGDCFSMQSFNLQERWLPAVKGAQNVSRVMNHFYDLHPDESSSDYLKAVNSLLKKRSKRSLVLLVTTLNDQDINDLLPAVKKLQQHHLVALINIENVTIKQILNSEIESENDANKYCAAIELNNIYQHNSARLAKEGVICVNTQSEYLLPYVINTYLNIKHSGLL
ncbi:DUF58 domain-containing protein [Catenovulum agarivorans]|uniref:DUF58 domain-containing protein n=1 Tax=Catenovulum agarivorans TaxID=1172192 RepID=UPI0002FD9FAF|nr:DUF58 domain-containing protein [Catenovulum agarivorans]